MMTTKSLARCIAVSLMALGAALAAPLVFSADKELNIYNWSDYIDESVVKDFEAKNGIKIHYDVFDTNEVLETKLLAGSSGYDLVVPSAYFLSRQIEAGVFQKLDKTKLPNLKNMWDMVSERTASYDAGNEHAIDYLWGTTGIGYNEDKIKAIMPDAPVNSWDMVFKPEIAAKFADCGIYMLDNPAEVISSVMRYLGMENGDTSPENLAKVEEVLMKVRPYVKKFHSSEYISGLANGDICLALGWSGDIFQAQSRAKEAKNSVKIEYHIPKEGAPMWFDMMAMPADAKNVEEAYLFLNYLMEPEVMAKVSNFVSYANGNKASQAFINKDILNNPAIYPTEDVLKGLFSMKTFDAKTQRLTNRLWTKIKSGS